MTSAFVGSAKLALQPGAVLLVKLQCNIVERCQLLHSALRAKLLRSAAALVVQVDSGMLCHIRAAALGRAKMGLNSRASVDNVFQHGRVCAAPVPIKLAASIQERNARRSWKMLSKTLCANIALAEPAVREATTLVNHCAAVLVSRKVFASRASQ